MPLRAYIEDKEIVSIDLNDEEWSALKARLKAVLRARGLFENKQQGPETFRSFEISKSMRLETRIRRASQSESRYHGGL